MHPKQRCQATQQHARDKSKSLLKSLLQVTVYLPSANLWVCACARVHVYECSSGGQRSTLSTISQVSFPLILSWDRIIHWPEVHWFRLGCVDSKSPEASCLCLLSAGITSIWHHVQHFTRTLRIKLRPLDLYSKHFPNQAIFSSTMSGFSSNLIPIFF